jgi:hypothetical protein
MRIELLDRRSRATRAERATAIFEWLEALNENMVPCMFGPLRRRGRLGPCH